jgi:lysophospholipase L1-like esterase
LRIITFGDSVTVGERDGVAPQETYSALLEESLSAKGLEVEVISRGRGGENTGAALQRLPEVLGLKPDYLIVMYGLNDAAVDEGKDAPRVSLEEYSDNLKTIVRKARAAGAVPVLMTPNPMCSFGVLEKLYGSREPYLSNGINSLLKHYAATVRQIGNEEQVPVLDIYSEFFQRAEDENLAPFLTDGMHPNPAGQKIIAQQLIRYFNESSFNFESTQY